MKNSINIYWNSRIIADSNTVDSEFLFSPPKPLLSYLKDILVLRD